MPFPISTIWVFNQVSIPDSIPSIIFQATTADDFPVVKEALNNIAKHAHASSVSIDINIDEKLKISLHDNGRGINLKHTITEMAW
jgi:signal transduction histidine kinase